MARPWRRRRMYVVLLVVSIMTPLAACARPSSSDGLQAGAAGQSTTTTLAPSSVPEKLDSALASVLDRLRGLSNFGASSIGPATSENVPAGAVAITLQTSATDPVGALRAGWVAEIAMAETWKAHRDSHLASVAGASLVGANGTSSEWMGAPAAELAFTNGDGQPSALTVKNQANYAADVRAAAIQAGATVKAISYTQSLGTSVEITYTVPDGRAFMTKWRRIDAGLKVHDGDVEGIFVVIDDPSGELVKAMYWTAAAQAGASLVNPKYADLYTDDPGWSPHSFRIVESED
jgi:hypothetical protein